MTPDTAAERRDSPRLIRIVPVLLVVLVGAGCTGGQAAERFDPLEAALGGRAPAYLQPITAAEWTGIRELFTAREFRPAWTSAGRLRPAFEDALALLEDADRDALTPAHYDVEWLRAERDRLSGLLSRRPAESDDEIVEIELRTTAAVLRWGRHLSVGRFNPARKERWIPAPRDPAPGAVIADALESGGVADLASRLRPPHGEYEALLQLRERYAALAAGEPWSPVGGTREVREGMKDRHVPALRARLAAEGDLDRRHVTDSLLLDEAVAAALRTFQARHGLPSGGVLGTATRAALNVSAAERLRQIEVNIERWRFLPLDLGPRHIRVNIPDYYLGLVEGGQVALGMRAVIGARGTPTPVLSDEMRHIVFSPYWNIPESIANDEIVPALLNDPDYLRRNDIEVVRVDGNRAEVLDPEEVDWAFGFEEGLRLRQRPGSANALGQVKFVLSNHLSIYLHDTPAEGAFERVSRALSHGCVRVERPVTLARTLLRDHDWDDERITAAMDQAQEQWVRLEEPLPVHLMYITAWVDAEGRAQFRADVYGHDAAHARALEIADRRARRGGAAPET